MAITFAVYVMEGKWRNNLPIALAVSAVDLLSAFTAMTISAGLLGEKNVFILIHPGLINNLSTSSLAVFADRRGFLHYDLCLNCIIGEISESIGNDRWHAV